MTKKLTKKQHYVPQFYLRNFTSDDNKLWVFDRVKEEYYFRAPKDVCYEALLARPMETVHRHSPHPDSISQQMGCLNDSGRL